jgi:hypothetical protein
VNDRRELSEAELLLLGDSGNPLTVGAIFRVDIGTTGNDYRTLRWYDSERASTRDIERVMKDVVESDALPASYFHDDILRVVIFAAPAQQLDPDNGVRIFSRLDVNIGSPSGCADASRMCGGRDVKHLRRRERGTCQGNERRRP